VNDMRHADTEELLALRDGEGTAWTRSHVDACAACAAELYRLEQVRARLKALPAFTPPRERWSVIGPMVRRERRQRFWRGAVGLATAAALTAVTFVAVRPAPSNAVAERAALARAMARSQTLEQALKAVRPDQRALNGDAAQAVAELQDQLSRIDAQLADPAAWKDRDGGRAVDLWQQRAGVLGALVDVHTTRAAMASF